LNIGKDTQFKEYFPPVYKVQTLSLLASNYLKLGELGTALEYANRAVALDYDMDKPFKDWPGYNTLGGKGELRYPYEVLGNVYLAQKDYKKALTAYEKAVKDFPLPSEKLLSNLNLAQIEEAKIK
jgi:tetratricopeptide (TPR) repeat protein